MCSLSEDKGATTNWCGKGWTGQPAVFERDGRTWVVFGAYDRAVHFVDAATGADILPPFLTGDIIKGSVTIDPDGYPLIYIGSRDDNFRVLAFDRPKLTELWSLDGEGRVAHAVERRLGRQRPRATRLALRRRREQPDPRGQAQPRHRCRRPGHRRARSSSGTRPDGTTSCSPTTATKCRSRTRSRCPATPSTSPTRAGSSRAGTSRRCSTGQGTPKRIFRFWTGDDTDGTIIVDEARHALRRVGVGAPQRDRSRPSVRCGSSNPAVPDDAARLVRQRRRRGEGRRVRDAGHHRRPRHLHDVHRARDRHRSRTPARSAGRSASPAPLMASPVIVDGVWLQGDCDGALHAYDVRNTIVDPPEVWQVPLGGCIESTPAVWKGRVYVGTRGGFVYAIGDASARARRESVRETGGHAAPSDEPSAALAGGPSGHLWLAPGSSAYAATPRPPSIPSSPSVVSVDSAGVDEVRSRRSATPPYEVRRPIVSVEDDVVPVLDVMLASGVATMAVACSERAAKGCRDGAGLRPDGERVERASLVSGSIAAVRSAERTLSTASTACTSGRQAARSDTSRTSTTTSEHERRSGEATPDRTGVRILAAPNSEGSGWVRVSPGQRGSP